MVAREGATREGGASGKDHAGRAEATVLKAREGGRIWLAKHVFPRVASARCPASSSDEGPRKRASWVVLRQLLGDSQRALTPMRLDG